MDNSVPTTRRSVNKLLGALSFVPLAPAPAAAAVDPHRAWLDEIDACLAEKERIYAGCATTADECAAEKGPIEVIYRHVDAMVDKLAATEATTLDGILVQTEVLTRDSFICTTLDVFENDQGIETISLCDTSRENCIKNVHAALTTLATKLGGAL